MITECPRCNAKLARHPDLYDYDKDKDVYFCPICPKVEWYKGNLQPWLSLTYVAGTSFLYRWSIIVPGWVLVRDYKYANSSIYNGMNTQYDMHRQGYNPPDDLFLKPEEETINFIKTYLVFQ